MNNIMLDLETMGNTPNSAIIAIAAVYFDETGIGETFYKKVSLESSCDAGLEMDPDTVLWWLKQDDAARKEFEDKGEPLALVLGSLRYFMNPERVYSTDLKVWGKGAAFDNVILANAFRKFKMPVPWKFSKDRCFRTVQNLFPHIQIPENTEKHNALADAIWQAKYCSKALRNIEKVKQFCI